MAMLLATAIAGLPLASEAKLGGGGGRSVSSGKAMSAPMASSSSSRLGSGGRCGDDPPRRDGQGPQRRPRQPALTLARRKRRLSGRSHPARGRTCSGPGWGTVAGAACRRRDCGYMLGDHNSQQDPGATRWGNAAGQGASPDMQRSAESAGAPMSPQNSSQAVSASGSLLGLLMLGGAGIWAFRRYQAAQQPGAASRATAGPAFKMGEGPAFGASAPAADAGVEQIALKTLQ